MSDSTTAHLYFQLGKHSSVHYAQRKLDFGAKSANETLAPKLRFLAIAFAFTFAFKIIKLKCEIGECRCPVNRESALHLTRVHQPPLWE